MLSDACFCKTRCIKSLADEGPPHQGLHTTTLCWMEPVLPGDGQGCLCRSACPFEGSRDVMLGREGGAEAVLFSHLPAWAQQA